MNQNCLSCLSIHNFVICRQMFLMRVRWCSKRKRIIFLNIWKPRRGHWPFLFFVFYFSDFRFTNFDFDFLTFNCRVSESRKKRLPGFPQRKIKDIQKKRRRQAATSKISRQLIKLPSCKALNLFQRPCKAKLLGESVFVKFISFITLYDIECCTRIRATAFGRNRRCIKSVQSSEKYCTYHKIKI